MTAEHNWRNEKFIYDQFYFQITFGVIVIIVAVLLGFVFFPEDMGYRSNLYTTAVGVLVTVSVLDLLAKRRADQQAERQLRDMLIRNAGSTSNETAKSAIDELRKKNLLIKGETALLKEQNLSFANWQGALLILADLSKADLSNANLSRANLIYANLQDASLNEVDLSEANLSEANLSRANIAEANLCGTDLYMANLTGVQWYRMKIFDVPQFTAKFDEKTILPDGTNWNNTVDFDRYADPNHPNFWDYKIIKVLIHWSE